MNGLCKSGKSGYSMYVPPKERSFISHKQHAAKNLGLKSLMTCHVISHMTTMKNMLLDTLKCGIITGNTCCLLFTALSETGRES